MNDEYIQRNLTEALLKLADEVEHMDFDEQVILSSFLVGLELVHKKFKGGK